MRWTFKPVWTLAVTAVLVLASLAGPAAGDVVIEGGDPDTVAPTIQSLTLSHDSLDVSTGPVAIQVTARVTDDKSGPRTMYVQIKNPLGGSGSLYEVALTSNTMGLDRSYVGTIAVDQYARPGTFEVGCFADDQKLNGTYVCPPGVRNVSVTGPGPDTTAPVIESLSLSHSAIDVSTGPVTVKVTARVTDDRSGPRTMYVRFRNPLGGSGSYFDAAMTSTTQGTDKTYVVSLGIDRYALPGTFIVDCFADDQKFNGTYACPAGTPDLQVTGQGPDTVAPVIESLILSQDSVDVSGGAVRLQVTARVTDDKSGPRTMYVQIKNPVGGSGSLYETALDTRDRGADRTYTGAIVVDQFARPGTFKVGCFADDQKYNGTYACPPETAVVIDFQPPTIDRCDAAAASVSTSNGATSLAVTSEVRDDAKGVKEVTATLTNDSANAVYSKTLALTGGDKLDGTWTGAVAVPANAPAGDYDLTCKAKDEVDRVTDTTTTPPASGTGGGTPPVVTITPNPLPGGGGPTDPPTDPTDPSAESGTADVSITKSTSSATAIGGDTVTYTLTATNATGAATATATKIVDVLPSGITFASADPGCANAAGTVTCTIGDLTGGATRTVHITAVVDAIPMIADDDTSHQIDEQKQETFLGAQAGQSATATAMCPSGTFATDGGVRLDAVDQGNKFADVNVVASGPAGDNAWTATIANNTTGQAQGKVWVACLGRTTYAGIHSHTLVTTAGPSAARTIAAGGETFTLTCPTGQTAIAPAYTLTSGDGHVTGSTGVDNAWTYAVATDTPTTGATGTFAISCLAKRTSATDGHVHDLNTHTVTSTGTVAAGATIETTLSCRPEAGEAKGVVSSVAVEPGLVVRGVDPQAKTRLFKFTNETAAARTYELRLLCVGIRTSGEPIIKTITNTATVSTTANETDTSDNTATATIKAYGDGWVLIPRTQARVSGTKTRAFFTLPTKATSAMTSTVTVLATRSVASANIRAGSVLSTAQVTHTTGTTTPIRLALTRTASKAAKAGTIRTVRVVIRTSDGNMFRSTLRVT